MRSQQLLVAAALVVAALASGAAFAESPVESDVAAAVRAAVDEERVVVVAVLDSTTPKGERLQRELLGSTAFQAWVARRAVLVIHDHGRPLGVDAATKERWDQDERELQVRFPPLVVLMDSYGRDHGQVALEKDAAGWIVRAEQYLRAIGTPHAIYQPPRSRTGVYAFFALVLAVVVGAVAFGAVRSARGMREAVAPTSRRPAAASASPVAQAPARVVVEDPTYGDRAARDLRAALVEGRWQPVEERFVAEKDHEVREFLVEALADWPRKSALAGRKDLVTSWASAVPSSPVPHLLEGRWLIDHAWEARGGGLGSTVGANAFAVFQERLVAADKALAKAAELAPDDPLPWAYQAITARGLEKGVSVAQKAFAEAVRRHSENRAAHWALLSMVAAKWSGSHEQMFDVARGAYELAPTGSWRPALVAMAHAERWLSISIDKEKDPFHGKAGDYWKQPAVRDELLAAYGKSLGSSSFVERSPRAAVERNWFAFCLWQIDAKDQLRRELEKIGARATELPWAWCGKSAFHDARDQVKLPFVDTSGA